MEKEFVPYELSLRLKEIGFKERVFSYFEQGVVKIYTKSIYGWDCNNSFITCVSRPTFSQAFRWFREKYAFYVVIKPFNAEFSCIVWTSKAQNHIGIFKTYEEAEIACLDRLLEIVEKENNTQQHEKNN